VYATAQHLRRLLPYRTVSELLSFARKKRIFRVQPDVVEGGTGLSVFISREIVDDW
jgi:hypothetical protein